MGLFSYFSSQPEQKDNTISKKYKIKSLKIVVQGELVEGIPSKVYLEGDSELSIISPGIEHSSRQLTSVSEFFKDTDEMVDYLNKAKSWGQEAISGALNNACRNHILKFGRLIDTDLNAYVLTLLKIIDAVSVTRLLQHMPPGEESVLRRSLIDTAYQNFTEYIWVNKPDYYPNDGLIRLVEDPSSKYYKSTRY